MNYFSRISAVAGALFALLLSFSSRAQAQTFDRAIVCASGGGYYGYNGWGPRAVAGDAQGNTYTTGTFNGTIQLGNTLLTATQTSPGTTMPYDNFVAKLDAAGNYVWAVQMGDGQAARAMSLAVDAAGNVYVAGFFRSYSARFGAAIILFNSSADSEAFVAKLDGATGQWLWARRAGGTGSDSIGEVAVNAAGEVYVIGSAESSAADFGPFTLNSPVAFLAKLSPAGVWLWARPVGSGAVAAVLSLCLDGQGGLYVAGLFWAPSATFGATTLTTHGIVGAPQARTGGEVFVAKTTDVGPWLWAVQGDALTHQNLVTGAGGLSLDGTGHLYLAGSYQSTAARFGATVLPNRSVQQPPLMGQPTPPPYPNNYWPDAFAARLDAATGAWDWASRNGGAYGDWGGQTVSDAQGRVYVLGYFNPSAVAGEDVSLAQLDGATGAWRSIQPLAPLGVRDLALDGQGHLHLAGYFNGATAQFGPVTLAQAGSGRQTGFLARMSAGPLAARAPARPGVGLEVWPNPASSGGGGVWVRGPRPGQAVEVLDVLGRRVAQGRMSASGPLHLTWPAALPAGMYVVRGGGQARRLLLE